MPTPTASYNIPSVNVSIADFGLRLSPPVPGKKLTLIGRTTATLNNTLIVNEPYQVADVGIGVNGLKNTDGTHSELSLAVEQAAAAGADNIEVIVCSQTSDYATVNDRWDALAACYKNIAAHPMDTVHPVDTWVDVSGLSGSDSVYTETRSNFGKQLANFCYRASKAGNSVQGVIGLKPLLQVAKDESWSSATTSDPQVKFATPTLAQLNEWVSHVRSLSGTLKDHSAETVMSNYVYGSVEDSPGVISSSYDWYAKETDGTTGKDHLGNKVDGGRAICVFGSVSRQLSDSIPDLAAKNGYAGTLSINTNGAVAYAALLSTLLPDVSPGNQTITSLIPARDIPQQFAVDMLNSRVVTMVNRTTGYVVSDGITSAFNAGKYTRSDYVNWTTYSIVLAAIDLCKLAAEPYLNKPASPAILNAMKNQIDRNLDVLKARQAVARITSTLIQSADQNIIGDLDVMLDIAIYGELKSINVKASLSRV